MLKTLFAPLQEFKRDTGLAALFTALEVVMEVLLPLVMALLIDQGISSGQMPLVVRYGVLMLVAAFLSLAFGVLSSRFAARASAGYACNLRESIFAKVQTFSFSNIDKFSTAGLVTRMTTDVTNLQNAFLMILRIGIRSPLMLLASLVLCLLISPRLSLIFLVAMVVLAVALGAVMAVTLPLFQKVFDRYDDLNASVQENVSAIRVVKAFVREEYENQKFQKAANALYRLFVKAEGVLALNNPVMMLVVYGCIIALSWFGAQFVVAGNLTTGELTSLSTYIMGILMSLMMLSMIVVVVAMSLASARRICQVLTEEPDLANPPQPIHRVKDGSIDFTHITFSYRQGSGEPVLRDIDLHIRAGETIGIVGGTGSGKSSLVSLICRLYDVDRDAVSVGGQDVRSYDLESLRQQVAVVLQKNVLFSGTIRSNIVLREEGIPDEEIRRVCHYVNADHFIDKLDHGLDEEVRERGNNFSAGQRQLLSFARTIIHKPSVMILDEATANIDTETELLIQDSLEKMRSVGTMLMVAHRLSTIQHADNIIVLSHGKILEQGTHQELLAKHGRYYQLYTLQYHKEQMGE